MGIIGFPCHLQDSLMCKALHPQLAELAHKTVRKLFPKLEWPTKAARTYIVPVDTEKRYILYRSMTSLLHMHNNNQQPDHKHRHTCNPNSLIISPGFTLLIDANSLGKDQKFHSSTTVLTPLIINCSHLQEQH